MRASRITTSPRSAKCAWLRETLPEATLCFMHPVKAEEAIAEAYFEHGVKTFSLDTLDELEKIVRATATDGVAATDLNLLVRLRVSSDHAKLSLAAKFGAEPARSEGAAVGCPPGVRRARHLLPCRQPGDEPGGLCRSHGPGPRRDRRGGGHGRHRRCRRRFPVGLSGHGAAALEAYFDGHPRRFEALPISYSAELWCEPGRACAPNMAACWSASKSAAATSCTSTTAPMARCSMPRTSAGAIRSS